MDGGVIAFVFAILIIAILIFVAILLTGKRDYKFNVEAYQTRFLAIKNKLNKNNPATFMNAVIESDKLLDKAMHEMGIPGKTMGERLKKSGTRFSDVDKVWKAHKLRNALAHEADLEITYKQAATAVLIYEQALKDLGAI